MEWWARSLTSWKKYQQPPICRWCHSNDRKWRWTRASFFFFFPFKIYLAMLGLCLCEVWVWKSLSCVWLCDPIDYSLPGSSVPGIVQTRILEWVPGPFSRGSSQSRDRIQVFHIAVGFFTIWATREALSCSTWDIVPWPGIEPGPPALGVQSLSHWTTREVPNSVFWGLSFQHGLCAQEMCKMKLTARCYDILMQNYSFKIRLYYQKNNTNILSKGDTTKCNNSWNVIY